MGKLEGKIAIVTGSGKGIGRDAALAIAAARSTGRRHRPAGAIRLSGPAAGARAGSRTTPVRQGAER